MTYTVGLNSTGPDIPCIFTLVDHHRLFRSSKFVILHSRSVGNERIPQKPEGKQTLKLSIVKWQTVYRCRLKFENLKLFLFETTEKGRYDIRHQLSAEDCVIISITPTKLNTYGQTSRKTFNNYCLDVWIKWAPSYRRFWKQLLNS